MVDDLAVMSRSTCRLQQLVFKAQEDASIERSTDSVTQIKSEVVRTRQQVLKAKEDMSIHLHGISVKISDQETHVSFERTVDRLNRATIEAKINFAR